METLWKRYLYSSCFLKFSTMGSNFITTFWLILQGVRLGLIHKLGCRALEGFFAIIQIHYRFSASFFLTFFIGVIWKHVIFQHM